MFQLLLLFAGKLTSDRGLLDPFSKRVVSLQHSSQPPSSTNSYLTAQTSTNFTSRFTSISVLRIPITLKLLKQLTSLVMDLHLFVSTDLRNHIHFWKNTSFSLLNLGKTLDPLYKDIEITYFLYLENKRLFFCSYRQILINLI